MTKQINFVPSALFPEKSNFGTLIMPTVVSLLFHAYNKKTWLYKMVSYLRKMQAIANQKGATYPVPTECVLVQELRFRDKDVSDLHLVDVGVITKHEDSGGDSTALRIPKRTNY